MNFPILRESVYEYFIYERNRAQLKGALECCKADLRRSEFFDAIKFRTHRGELNSVKIPVKTPGNNHKRHNSRPLLQLEVATTVADGKTNKQNAGKK
ncbi:hypothetical protein TcasGA2_TC001127 [Tribolium castaneum]|uniref:Uncharacterized protein n=1 Tax=Tribolium castaneum TaxID=7070 RepID=D6WAA4_TRICA|nr:hypothetical protein TcasGA2_TC001127 [Tribolium castaneum]